MEYKTLMRLGVEVHLATDELERKILTSANFK